MKNVIQQYWLDTGQAYNFGFVLTPRVHCKDGFTMSVQASESHYCEPRELLADGDYTKWEVGFPSEDDTELLPYSQNDDDIFSWVPTDVVNAIIAKHGGIRVGP